MAEPQRRSDPDPPEHLLNAARGLKQILQGMHPDHVVTVNVMPVGEKEEGPAGR